MQRCTVTQRGMGKKESGGLGEKTQKGKGDKHLGCAPLPWGCLPKTRAYPERFTIVRETTSLGEERAQQAAYSLPSQRFSLALSFPHPPHSCGETSACDGSHDFRRQTLFSTVLCSIMGQQNSCIVSQRGMGKKESGGLGEKTRKGKGDKHLGCAPLSLGLSPQDTPPRHPQSKIQQKAPPEIPGVLFPIAQRAMHQFIMVFSVSLSNR